MAGNVIRAERNSSIELLRILLMLMIIAGHYSVHGGYSDFTQMNLSWQIVVLQILSFGGSVANDAFILITGYYMICSEMKYRRIGWLIAEMFFYSWLVIIFRFWMGEEMSFALAKEMIKACLPVFWGQSFAVCYILLCLLIPYLNQMLLALSQEAYRKLMLVLLFVLTIVPTVTLGTWSDKFGIMSSFIYLYMLGGYVRLFGLSGIIKYKSGKRLLGISAGCLAICVCAIDVISKHFGRGIFIQILEQYNSMNNLLVISIAIALFEVFRQWTFNNRLINRIAASVFGIYLLHNAGVIQVFLWQIWWPNAEYVSSALFPVHLLIKVIIIFAVCLLIDTVRNIFVEQPLRKYFK